MSVTTNILLGLLLAGLLMPATLLLPERIRGGWVAMPVALVCVAVVFFVRRDKSKRY